MVTNNAANNKTAATGKVLQGQGVGTASDFSTATYPSTATGTGKILRADGTNWVASTATYPDTAGTSGNVLTSDGTNWSSSAVTGPSQLNVAILNLTNAQIKAANATPVTIVAAQGAGKAIIPVQAWGKMIYGGTNVFTAAAGQTIVIKHNSAALTSAETVIPNANIIAAATRYSQPVNVAYTTGGTADIENTAIVVWNPSGTEITGNAANNNTMSICLLYYVVTM